MSFTYIIKIYDQARQVLGQWVPGNRRPQLPVAAALFLGRGGSEAPVHRHNPASIAARPAKNRKGTNNTAARH
jgi:hypothetical protein